MADFETQRRLADVLRQQAAQPIQAGNAPVSLTQGLEKLFQGFAGGRLSNLANQGEEKKRQQITTEMQQLANAMRTGGAPANDPGLANYMALSGQTGGAQPAMPQFQTPEVAKMAIEYQMSRDDPSRMPAELATYQAMTQGLNAEEQELARRISLGLAPRAVGSANITTATTPGLTETVAGSESAIRGAVAEAEETARLTVQGDLRPKIEADIAAAKSAAESQGQAFTERARLEASLPGLQEVVSRLRALSDVATYTRTGQAFNAVARELGFAPTEAATARAAYIATIDNEILPLLRDTFGAQFTEREGQSLKATLGDPNMSPQEKNAVLDAFIAAKTRNLETRSGVQGAMGAAVPPSQQGAIPAPAAQPPIQLEELGDVDAILRREGYLQ